MQGDCAASRNSYHIKQSSGRRSQYGTPDPDDQVACEAGQERRTAGMRLGNVQQSQWGKKVRVGFQSLVIFPLQSLLNAHEEASVFSPGLQRTHRMNDRSSLWVPQEERLEMKPDVVVSRSSSVRVVIFVYRVGFLGTPVCKTIPAISDVPEHEVCARLGVFHALILGRNRRPRKENLLWLDIGLLWLDLPPGAFTIRDPKLGRLLGPFIGAFDEATGGPIGRGILCIAVGADSMCTVLGEVYALVEFAAGKTL
jgi:hypothetical protein